MMSTSQPDHGRVDVDYAGHTATVWLRRAAKRNAITPEMLVQLEAHAIAIAESTARVVVVRGEGDKAFCVGADIHRFATLTPVEMLDWTVRGHRAFDAIAALPQPSIAVVHGPAIGGGFELALACDLRVMSHSASFALPETGLGTVPGWGGTERLTDLIGRSRAKEVILARRTVDAVSAEQWGLVAEAVQPDELELAVTSLVERIVTGAPVAIRLAKVIIDAAADGAPSRVLEQLAGAVTSATDDLAAGVAAFSDRTTARFEGR